MSNTLKQHKIGPQSLKQISNLLKDNSLIAVDEHGPSRLEIIRLAGEVKRLCASIKQSRTLEKVYAAREASAASVEELLSVVDEQMRCERMLNDTISVLTMFRRYTGPALKTDETNKKH